MSKGICGFKD